MRITPGLWVTAERGSFLALVSIALLSACTDNRQYRDVLSTDAKRAEVEVATDAGYKLGFVEFDEEGWFWDVANRQTAAVENLIEHEAAESKAAGGPIVLLYVHGWKNNASYDNADVQMVRAVLAMFSAIEQKRVEGTSTPPRRVVGVYVGWRGLSAEVEPFKELSFYERKSTVEKVGHGALTELLVRLDLLRNRLNEGADNKLPQTELILAGHSMGADALYTATSQIIMERFLQSTRAASGGRPAAIIKPIGDLVILLNPAFEASAFYDLWQRASDPSIVYDPRQLPVIAVFASEADSANRIWFKVGRSISTAFEDKRNDALGPDERAAVVESIGNFSVGSSRPFVTHELTADSAHTLKADPGDYASVSSSPPLTPDELQEALNSPKNNRSSFRDRRARIASAQPERLRMGGCILQGTAGYRSGDPFWVISVSSELVPSHSAIDQRIFVNFLRDFVAFSLPRQP